MKGSNKDEIEVKFEKWHTVTQSCKRSTGSVMGGVESHNRVKVKTVIE